MGESARRWWLLTALALASVASALFMRSVFVAPVAGDDRMWYPALGAQESWSITDELAHTPEWWEQRTHKGRVNVVTDLERRTAGRLTIEASVSTGTPTYIVNGLLKLLLALASVLTLAALLKSLRCRREDGILVRLPSRTVLLCTGVGVVLFALGGQPPFHEVNGRNGWVTYPTHTFGAVVSILGVTALVLWLTRLYAEGRHRLLIVLILVSLAVVTNLRYELVFPAIPLTLIALLIVPVTSSERVADGRRAKWVTGTSFTGVFVTIFLVLRVYLREICAGEPCYLGVTPHLSWEIVGTFWKNLVSSIPGITATRVAEFIESRGVSTEEMYTPTPWSVAMGAGMTLALLTCWWATRRIDSPDLPSGDPSPDDATAHGSDEGRLLLVAALLCLLGALGAALVMSLSVNAQGSSELGLPYRHTVVTWAGLAWALGLCVLALRHRSAQAGAVTFVAMSVAVGVAAALLMPANERSLAADRVDSHATEAAFAALVEGDLSDDANADRCQLVPGIEEERVDAAEAFDAAFRRYWGQEFCRR